MSNEEANEDGEEENEESDSETVIQMQTCNDKKAEATTRQKNTDRSLLRQHKRKRSIMRIFAKVKLVLTKPWRRPKSKQTYVEK